MRRLCSTLLFTCAAALAQDSMSALFLGLKPSAELSADLAQKYGNCLRDTMQKRGAFSFLDLQSVETDKLQKFQNANDSCKLDCQSALVRTLGVDYVISGQLEKIAYGYRSSLQIIYADSAKESAQIDWNIVGSEKDLFGDGCKNGGGVIYNYLATPEAKVRLKLPPGYNYELIRDQAINRSDVYKLVQILREKEERDGALSKKNPDASKSGGEKQR